MKSIMFAFVHSVLQSLLFDWPAGRKKNRNILSDPGITEMKGTHNPPFSRFLLDLALGSRPHVLRHHVSYHHHIMAL